MSRTIFAAILGVGLLSGFGCGSKPEPTQPNAVLTPEPKPDPNPAQGKVKVAHEMDPAKHVIPAAPVAGRLGNTEITVAEARVEGLNLIFQKPENQPGEPWRVSIELPTEPGREGSPGKMMLAPTDTTPGTTSWTVDVDFPSAISLPAWEVLGFKGWQQLSHLRWRGGCAITLEWGKRENGKLPGKVYLSLPDIEAHADTPSTSVLAGTFVAEIARLPTDPPGPDQVPYVKGTVNLKVPAPNANLRVGYISSLPMDNLALGLVSADLDGRQQARANYDKPHLTSLLAGDGQAAPSHYEHSKLTPGRYLVFASLKDGPIAWKWVDVKSGATITIDLTLDASQVGGLEVAVPLEALGKVQLSPAEDAGQPAPSETFVQGSALQLGLEADIVNRKAKFAKLAPGRYEVRAGKQSRTVEIVAGKFVELDFDKK